MTDDPRFQISDGNTPIDEDEAHGLRPSWIRTRSDLNDAEAANILKARQAIRPPSVDDVTDDIWLRKLHQMMFGDVWSWAGSYRLSNRNIGIDWQSISPTVRELGRDCRTWIVHDNREDTVARFHHRLVAIHPFPNGNGRHARAAADYLSQALDLAPPTWGANAFDSNTALRAAYLRALRTADRDPENLEPLVAFMRN